jgi:hypothetical protein
MKTTRIKQIIKDCTTVAMYFIEVLLKVKNPKSILFFAKVVLK